MRCDPTNCSVVVCNEAACQKQYGYSILNVTMLVICADACVFKYDVFSSVGIADRERNPIYKSSVFFIELKIPHSYPNSVSYPQPRGTNFVDNEVDHLKNLTSGTRYVFFLIRMCFFLIPRRWFRCAVFGIHADRKEVCREHQDGRGFYDYELSQWLFNEYIRLYQMPLGGCSF